MTSSSPLESTSIADPIRRLAEDTESSNYRGLDSTSTPATTSTNTHHQVGQEQDESMVNKVLDAVGLTGAVEAASAALGFGHQHETADELRDTSPIASHPGLVSAESGPPRHYRRESIPTTAYPGGLNSPRAVAPPIGGTQNQSSPTGYSSHVDRDINTGVDSVADDVRAPQETVRFRRRLQSITGGSDNTAPPIPSTFDMPTATSGAVHEYGSGQTFSTDDASEIVSQPTVQPGGRDVPGVAEGWL